MTIQDIRKLSTEDLKKLVLKSKEELFKLRFQKATGNLPNVARLKQVRRTIARAKFALNEMKSKEKVS